MTADITPTAWVRLQVKLERLEAENARHLRKIEHLEVALAVERTISAAAGKRLAVRSRERIY